MGPWHLESVGHWILEGGQAWGQAGLVLNLACVTLGKFLDSSEPPRTAKESHLGQISEMPKVSKHRHRGRPSSGVW